MVKFYFGQNESHRALYLHSCSIYERTGGLWLGLHYNLCIGFPKNLGSKGLGLIKLELTSFPCNSSFIQWGQVRISPHRGRSNKYNACQMLYMYEDDSK